MFHHFSNRHHHPFGVWIKRAEVSATRSERPGTVVGLALGHRGVTECMFLRAKVASLLHPFPIFPHKAQLADHLGFIGFSLRQIPPRFRHSTPRPTTKASAPVKFIMLIDSYWQDESRCMLHGLHFPAGMVCHVLCAVLPVKVRAAGCG